MAQTSDPRTMHNFDPAADGYMPSASFGLPEPPEPDPREKWESSVRSIAAHLPRK